MKNLITSKEHIEKAYSDTREILSSAGHQLMDGYSISVSNEKIYIVIGYYDKVTQDIKCRSIELITY